MGGFFLYPLILAGAALIAIPWLVHQIRRPERDIKPFSSLMFVPKIKRKVIERRSIQHILLMLLRMALVILMVLAFARPYRLFSIAPSAAAGQAADHVILLDTSFSMGAGSNFEEAKNQALQIVNGLESNERAALLPFHQTADISHTFVEGETASQNKQRIRQAIRQAKLTQQSTNYYSVLDAAREVLTPKSQEEIEKERHIHLITDFQQKGFPTQQPFHKLPSAYQLHCLPIGTKAQNRFAITDMHLQKQADNQFRVLAQIKNGFDTHARANATLFLNEEKTASKTISIEPGFTNKIDLDFQIAEDTPFQGYLQVEQDALELDNRRYFAWNPIPKKQIRLIADNPSLQPGEPAWFVEQALRIRENEWHVETTPPPKMNDAISSSAPNCVLFFLNDDLSLPRMQPALRYVQDGGALLLLPHRSQTNAFEMEQIFATLGLNFLGMRYPEAQTDRYQTINWVDFEHPVFLPFRESRFNDFSSIRFFNHIVFSLPTNEQKQNTVIARFEGGSPAILETPLGEGRILLWAFPPDTKTNTVAKSPKFVPLLFESISHLVGKPKIRPTYLIGESLPQPNRYPAARWRMQRPQDTTFSPYEPQTAMHPTQAGIYKWQTAGPNPRAFADAVNVDAEESDLTRVPIPEFKTRVASPSLAESQVVHAKGNLGAASQETVKTWEYGRYILVLLMIGFIAESAYAARLAQKRQDETKET